MGKDSENPIFHTNRPMFCPILISKSFENPLFYRTAPQLQTTQTYTLYVCSVCLLVQDYLSTSCNYHTDRCVWNDFAGKVYATGRYEYGRLGLGEDKAEKTTPTQINTLNGTKCSTISCGSSVSFAVTDQGKIITRPHFTGQQFGELWH